MATPPSNIYDLDADSVTDNPFSYTLDDAFKNEIIPADASKLDTDNGEDYGLTVWLYQDNSFANWKTHVEQTAIYAALPGNVKNYILDYSDYNIAIQCNLNNIDGNDSSTESRANFGCCLRDDSELQNGGYCLLLNTQ